MNLADFLHIIDERGYGAVCKLSRTIWGLVGCFMHGKLRNPHLQFSAVLVSVQLLRDNRRQRTTDGIQVRRS